MLWVQSVTCIRAAKASGCAQLACKHRFWFLVASCATHRLLMNQPTVTVLFCFIFFCCLAFSFLVCQTWTGPSMPVAMIVVRIDKHSACCTQHSCVSNAVIMELAKTDKSYNNDGYCAIVFSILLRTSFLTSVVNRRATTSGWMVRINAHCW